MTVCPKCRKELQKLDEDILGETEEFEGVPNWREYTCPFCGAILGIELGVSYIEVKEEE